MTDIPTPQELEEKFIPPLKEKDIQEVIDALFERMRERRATSASLWYRVVPPEVREEVEKRLQTAGWSVTFEDHKAGRMARVFGTDFDKVYVRVRPSTPDAEPPCPAVGPYR